MEADRARGCRPRRQSSWPTCPARPEASTSAPSRTGPCRPRLVGKHPADDRGRRVRPRRRAPRRKRQVGEIRIWPTAGRVRASPWIPRGRRAGPLPRLQPGREVARRPSGRLANMPTRGSGTSTAPLVSEAAAVSSGPRSFTGRRGFEPVRRMARHSPPGDRASGRSERPTPASSGRHDWFVDDVAFTPDGTTLLSASAGRTARVRAWPLSPGRSRADASSCGRPDDERPHGWPSIHGERVRRLRADGPRRSSCP